jgi:hypothetical protein
MARRITWFSLLLAAALSLGWQPPDSGPKDVAQKPKVRTAQELRAKLAAPVNLERGIEANSPFKDAMEFLADRYEVPIFVDRIAFSNQGAENVEEQQVRLPKMIGVRLSTILSMLVAQVKGTFLVHKDYVEVTTFARTRAELWSTSGMNREGALAVAQMVTAEFDRQPLDEALRELADQSGINVVVDARAADKARTAVTATLTHVPLDTAVEVLADMADLKSLAIDNVIYVTSKANAKRMQKELVQQRTGEMQ